MTMSNYILKPCPFCGGKAELYTTANASIATALVRCLECEVRTSKFVDLDNDGSFVFNAITDWNRRVGEDQ